MNSFFTFNHFHFPDYKCGSRKQARIKKTNLVFSASVILLLQLKGRKYHMIWITETQIS